MKSLLDIYKLENMKFLFCQRNIKYHFKEILIDTVLFKFTPAMPPDYRSSNSKVIGFNLLFLARTEMQLQQFESSSRDNLSVFGQNMPAFVAKIKQMHQQGRFTELPRGPLGQYIKVKDKKWTAMIETVISPGILTAFYVNSDADRNTLNQLIQREFPEMRGRSIITSRFHKEVYDVRSGRVETVQNAHMLMNLINVSDPVVMNCLIDQIKIETILVVDDQNLAMDLTSHTENVPRNLQKVVVMEPFSEFFPMPNYRSYGLQKKSARYLQVNLLTAH